MYSNEEFDKNKSKVLRYILFKKRTEQEVRQKFSKDIEENMLDDIINNLKENSYLNDYIYIEKSIKDFIKLKHLSIKEIKYKLYSKGLNSSLVDEYISENFEELKEYEIQSAYNIMCKKAQYEKEDINLYLLKKGYKQDSIEKAIFLLEGKE